MPVNLRFFALILFALSLTVSGCSERTTGVSPYAVMESLRAELPDRLGGFTSYGFEGDERSLTEEIKNKLYGSGGKTSGLSGAQSAVVCIGKDLYGDDYAGEIGIFLAYTKSCVPALLELCRERIKKLQDEQTENAETVNNAEARSYERYVYYAVLNPKDEAFEIIEKIIGVKANDK